MFSQEQHDEVIRRRHKIVVDYCKNNGWNPADLTIEQIMEIRSLEEWKDVPKNVLEGK